MIVKLSEPQRVAIFENAIGLNVNQMKVLTQNKNNHQY